MLQEQKMYQKRLDMKVRSKRDSHQIKSFVFLRCEHVQCGEATPKLVLIADQPYEATTIDDKTVAIKIGTNIERVSRDRVVTLSASDTGTLYPVTVSASHQKPTRPSPSRHGIRFTIYGTILTSPH